MKNKMNFLTIKDNSWTHNSEFDSVPILTSKVVNKTLSKLNMEGIFIYPESVADSVDLSSKQIILQEVDNGIRIGNLVGSIGTHNERLNIVSRFSDSGKNFFFQYLLERVLKVPNLMDLNTNLDNQDEISNLIIFLFPFCLGKALRKGLYKTYVKIDRNDMNPKGPINISRQNKYNIPFLGKIAYSERNLSIDNEMMELIRHAIEYIRLKSFGTILLKDSKINVDKVISATPNYKIFDRKEIINFNIEHPIRHAYFQEYRLLQRLCIKILKSDQVNFGNGKSVVNGILFDCAWLWEEYINSLISDMFYHPENKTGKGAQELFNGKNGKVGLIFPDFIGKSTHNRVIADTKYKFAKNIKNKDYLQMLAYMYRFESKKGIFIYPEKCQLDNDEYKLNSGSTFEKNVGTRDVTVIKMGLEIPQKQSSYSNFKNQIAKNELTFKKQLKEYIEN